MVFEEIHPFNASAIIRKDNLITWLDGEAIREGPQTTKWARSNEHDDGIHLGRTKRATMIS